MKKPSEILKEAREARFKSAQECAKAYGWNQVTYRSHENGTRGMGKAAATKYATKFGLDPLSLMGMPTSETDEVPVIGEVALGVWRDKSIDAEQYKNKTSLNVPRGAEKSMRFAVKIMDESIDRLIPKGGYAICSPRTDLAPKSLVVVERTRGDLVEMSIRKVIRTKSGLALTGHSTSKKFNEEMPISGRTGDRIEVKGLVIGVYNDVSQVD